MRADDVQCMCSGQRLCSNNLLHEIRTAAVQMLVCRQVCCVQHSSIPLCTPISTLQIHGGLLPLAPLAAPCQIHPRVRISRLILCTRKMHACQHLQAPVQHGHGRLRATPAPAPQVLHATVARCLWQLLARYTHMHAFYDWQFVRPGCVQTVIIIVANVLAQPLHPRRS